jgi:hypothetical protein
VELALNSGRIPREQVHCFGRSSGQRSVVIAILFLMLTFQAKNRIGRPNKVHRRSVKDR